MKNGFRRHPWALIAALAALVGAAAPCRAADASAWDADLHSSLRLIAGSARKDDGAPLRAAIELQLQPGWKTYWRYPGDSGLPPRFDFTGSQNVRSATVLWPAPARFPDGGGGESIGYRADVTFPVHVVPQDPQKPVTLRLKAEYGVCEKICVPAQSNVQLQLTSAPSAHEASVAAAERRVPARVAPSQSGMLVIHAARRDATGSRPRVIVDVTVPTNVEIDLFAEGPTPDWALPLPKRVEGAPGGMSRFAFDIDGLPPGATIEGAKVTFTLVAGENAIEASTKLD